MQALKNLILLSALPKLNAPLLSFEEKAPHDHCPKCCSQAQIECIASMVLCLIYKGTASSTLSALFYSFVQPPSVPAPGPGHRQVLQGQQEGGISFFQSSSCGLFSSFTSQRFCLYNLTKNECQELLA